MEEHLERALRLLDGLDEEVRRAPLDEARAWPAHGALILDAERLARELAVHRRDAVVPTEGAVRVPLGQRVRRRNRPEP